MKLMALALVLCSAAWISGPGDARAQGMPDLPTGCGTPPPTVPTSALALPAPGIDTGLGLLPGAGGVPGFTTSSWFARLTVSAYERSLRSTDVLPRLNKPRRARLAPARH